MAVAGQRVEAGPYWEGSQVKLNVFEGARRISLALGALWLVGCIGYAVVAEPYVSATFAIPGLGEPPVKTDRCADDDATAYTTTKTSKGHSVGISLCYSAQKSADGRRLVPYSTMTRVPDGTPAGMYVEGLPTSMSRADVIAKLKANGYQVSNIDAVELARPLKAEPYAPGSQEVPIWGHYLKMDTNSSSEVYKYTAEAKNRLTLGSSDLERLEELHSRAVFVQWKVALQVLAGGLAFGWLFMAATGWIVRGFMGISRGKDSRPVT
jgi:hypothetical protein